MPSRAYGIGARLKYSAPPALSSTTFTTLGFSSSRTSRIGVQAVAMSAPRARASIEATSVGELDPMVKTADETPEPRNRRVEIAVR